MINKKLLKMIISGEIKTEAIYEGDNGSVDLRIRLNDKFSCEINSDINNTDSELEKEI